MDNVKLGELIRIKHGWAFKGNYFSDAGEYIVLTPANFYESGGFKETPGKEKYYTGEFPKEYLCEAGDLIVAMTQQSEGLLGATARVPVDGVYLHNQRIGLITAKSDLVDLSFIDYLMRVSWVRQQIEGSASGTKVKHTSPEKLYDVDVAIPSYKSQARIGALLSTIDVKIDNNKKLMAELEATARLVYDYWFTQFDFPDENGRPYRSSGGKMTWSDALKREIPHEWRAGTMSDVAIITMGQSPSGDSYNEVGLGCVFYQGRVDFGDFYPQVRMYTTAATRYAQQDDILLSVRAPVGDTNFAYEGCCIGRGLAALRGKVGSSLYVRFALNDFDTVFDRMNGNGTTFGSIDKAGLNGLKIPVPPENLLVRYQERVEPCYQALKSLEHEVRELASLRDWLLPMLMNGQAIIRE